MKEEDHYAAWKQRRASAADQDEIADRVMARIADQQVQPAADSAEVGLNAKRGFWPLRVALCGSALCLGALRFVYLAYVAKLLPF